MTGKAANNFLDINVKEAQAKQDNQKALANDLLAQIEAQRERKRKEKEFLEREEQRHEERFRKGLEEMKLREEEEKNRQIAKEKALQERDQEFLEMQKKEAEDQRIRKFGTKVIRSTPTPDLKKVPTQIKIPDTPVKEVMPRENQVQVHQVTLDTSMLQ